MTPERDYSHRSAVDKLGVKPGHVVAIVEEAWGLEAWLRAAVWEGVGRPTRPDRLVDVVLATVAPAMDAVELLRTWKTRIAPAGGIWLLTRKRGHPDYLDQRELIVAGIAAGVVDNKSCSLSDAVSALRFVIRRADRPAANRRAELRASARSDMTDR